MLNPALWKYVKDYCKKDGGMTVSEFIHKAVLNYLESLGYFDVREKVEK